MEVHHPHKMSGGPQLSGSSLAFTLTVLKELFVYVKHKRRRAIDLLDDFVELKLEVDDLLARWMDLKERIERESTPIEKNLQHTSLGNKVLWIKYNYEKLELQYGALCRDLESRVKAASGLNAGTEEQRSLGSEHEYQSHRNGNQTNTSGAANENQVNIGEQKIWTRKFFKLARLDKDVVKLKPKVYEVKMALEVTKLTTQAKPKTVERMKAEKLGNILPHHQRHLDDLLDYVTKQNYKRIGVIGEVGVGKTNILKNLNNCFDPSSPTNGWSAEYVIWVTVPEENNQEKLIQTIQEEIIERLKLTGGKRITQNADIISSFLSKKKYLLLFDDFSPLVKLEVIGIQEEHEQGKVVMEATSSNALRNVQLDKTIEIKRLLLREAHAFFKHSIDNYNGLPRENKEMVHPILRKLGGLPGFIKLTANYLNANRDSQDWKGIMELSQSDVRLAKSLGIASVIGTYKKLYEDLSQNYLQKCLLYAALFPSYYRICRNTLVECWKAENFLDCRSPTLNAARATGTFVFNQLTSSGLLESCGEKHVRMSIIFRKVAFDISFPEERDGALCVRSRSDRDGPLEEKEWNNARRLSFIRNEMESESLPTCPKCEEISTLFLQQNPNLMSIQSSFFINMKVLRVLSLHDTGITSLPTSIACLIALRSLYLNDCDGLNGLPTTINLLKELEVLDIRGTSIPRFPDEILNIVGLRCLRISFAIENLNLPAGSKRWKFLNLFSPNPSWVIFPPEAHTKLSNLEEMAIDLRGEVTDQVRDAIEREAAKFKVRIGFKFELGPPPGQSSGPNSQASKAQTKELSEISDGQNTSQRPLRGQSDSPEIDNPVERPLGTSTREDKGKGAAELPGQSEPDLKHRARRQPRAPRIEEPSETNTTSIYPTVPDNEIGRDLENGDGGLAGSAGEGTSSSRGGH